MEYAALLSSHSQDSPGIIGPYSSPHAAASEGAAVARAQPGVRFETVKRRTPNEPWRGPWRGETIPELIESMVRR
jgi:hypothetical protein